MRNIYWCHPLDRQETILLQISAALLRLRSFNLFLAPPLPSTSALVQLRAPDQLQLSLAKMEGQQQLASILTNTLSPDANTRRGAERELLAAQGHPSFGPLVLQLAQDGTAQKAVRQSAALSFKNWIKANWAVSRVELSEQGKVAGM